MNKREKILLGVALFFLLLAVRVFWPSGADAPAPASAPDAAASVKGGAEAALLAFTPLRLDALHQPRPKYRKFSRNPFTFGAAVVVEDAARKTELEQMRQTAEDQHLKLLQDEQKRVEAQRAQTPPKQAPPQFDLLFVGYVGPAENEIAIFRDGKDYLLAKRGEVMKNQYEVVSIGYESVEIKFPHGETHRYPLATGLQTLRR